MSITTPHLAPPTTNDHVSDDHVVGFLAATNPCYANLPYEFRDGAREYLRRALELGHISEGDLAEYGRIAEAHRFLED